MDLFKPSQKILDMICNENEPPLIHYEVWPHNSLDEMYKLQTLYVPGLFEKMNFFYSHELGGDKNRLDIQGINNVSGELFKNWIDHSKSDLELITGLYLGRKGVCYGFYDSGDFFKDLNIKNIVESKKEIIDFQDVDSENTGQSGFNEHIYSCSDLLEVDTTKGIIYAVQFLENIIAPVGEHGSQYCYTKRKSVNTIDKNMV